VFVRAGLCLRIVEVLVTHRIKQLQRGAGACALLLCVGAPAAAQSQHDMPMVMNMDMSGGWHFMQDGVLFGIVNHQGGPRGDDELKAPNWWMGMASRRIGATDLALKGMFSLDAATAGKAGYADLFQVGETLDGRPLVDRQHPHDFFMQLAAVWRVPLGGSTGLTLAGGPAGEAALGPVAFMHRASAAEYPFAPLSHHTFDSTHVAYGVVTAAIDRGPFMVEASVFNGREPDEHRWNFDFGRLDSVSGRIWFAPTERWEFQASTGHLVHPEALEPGNVERTTASAAWMRTSGRDYTAATVGYGVNDADEGTRHGVFGEFTRHTGRNSAFARLELQQVETELLLEDAVPSRADAGHADTVAAFTFGGVRDVAAWRGFEGGLGAAVVLYRVPDALSPAYGNHPLSFQLFFRLRPPAGHTGRMWNMRMSGTMAGMSM
jgi:hypothetical protein